MFQNFEIEQVIQLFAFLISASNFVRFLEEFEDIGIWSGTKIGSGSSLESYKNPSLVFFSSSSTTNVCIESSLKSIMQVKKMIIEDTDRTKMTKNYTITSILNLPSTYIYLFIILL